MRDHSFLWQLILQTEEKNKIMLLPYAFLSILKEHGHDSVEKSRLIHHLLKRSSLDNILRKKGF